MLDRFVAFNRRLSFALTPKHLSESNVFSMYRKCALAIFGRSDIRTVLDIGAGRAWQFSASDKEAYQLKLIGIDIDADEMAYNDTLDEAVIADVTRPIPIDPGTIDFVTCHSGVEHFSNNDEFLKNAYHVLRPGGLMLMQFPTPTAPFAILNRILPARVTRWLLHRLVPGSDGVLGFKAYYDRTSYKEFSRLAEDNDFDIDYHFPGYFSAGYFAFFTPLYFLALGYDFVRFVFGIKGASSYNLFVLRKGRDTQNYVSWTR